MTVETAVLHGEDPYEGLRELTIKIMALVHEAIEKAQAFKKMRVISGGGPGVFDDIANFLRNLWGWFPAAWEWLGNHFTWLKDSILGWWHGAIERIVGTFNQLRDLFLSKWHSLTSWLITHFTWLKDSILGWWHGALESLKAHLTWLKDTLLGWWHGAINWIVGTFNTLRDWFLDKWHSLTSWLISHLTWLKDSILGWWHGAIDRLRATWENLKLSIENRLERLCEHWRHFREHLGTILGEALIRGLTNLWNLIVSGARWVWERVGPIVMDFAEVVIPWARPTIERWVEGFKEIPAAFLEWVVTTAGTNLALKPSQALTTAGSLYAMSITTGSLAHGTATALNLIPSTDWVGASQFAAFIAEAAAFEPLTRATYGVLLNDALAWPLRYHWNYQLRPKLPTEGALLLMGRKRGLSEGEWRLAMAYQGIPDWYLDKIYLFNWTDPSPFWVSRVTEAHIPDWRPDETWAAWADQWMPGWRTDPFKWVRAKLLLAGYEKADVDSMIEAIHAKLMASAITQVKTSVRAMLRDAYWTKANAEGALRPMGVRQEEIELLYVAEELDYQKGYLDDQVRYYKEAYRKGEIDLQDLNLALSTIIVKPERVAQEVARERVRALKKPKPITQPKEDPLVTRLRRQAIDSWIRLYRDWEIEAEDLLLGLTIVVEDPDLAREMVDVELTRVRPPPPVPPPPVKDPIVAKSERQAIASWIKAFRDEDIDAGELELGLHDLIPDVETRTQVIQLEQLRYRPTPELIPPVSEDPNLAKIRAERVRGHIEMFQKRLIVIEQLYSYLLADGLVEPVARATVITQASKRIKVPALDSPYFLQEVIRDLIDQGLLAYEEMYMEKKITIDQYTAWLTSIAADPDVVTYLADTLTLRRFLEGL